MMDAGEQTDKTQRLSENTRDPGRMSIEEAVTPMRSGPDVDPISLDLFEGITDHDGAVCMTPRYSVYKKLEVVNARRINNMAVLFNIFSIVGLMASAVVILLARFKYGEEFAGIPAVEEGTFMNISVYTFPPAFVLVDTILSLATFASSVLLLLVFFIVLVREGKNKVLNEQVWVLMLLIGTVLYFNPHEAIVRLRRDYFFEEVPELEDGFSYIDLFTCLRMVSFSVISILYLWMGAHSYRCLSERISYRHWQFYAPKIAIVLLYNVYKLFIFFFFRIICAELPFATLIAFIYLYASLDTWPRLGVITVLVLTTIELIIFALIAFEIVRTSRVHKEVEYVKHRTKIVGFRFFLHQHFIFYIVYAVIYLLILFGLPNGLQLLQFVVLMSDETSDGRSGGSGRGSYFDIQYAPFGLQLCILAYVAMEMYVNLPAIFSIKKWMSSSRWEPLPNGIEAEPVVYRNTEPVSFDGEELEIKPNCFIMQTNIDLFNLAWFVYYKGTRKESTLQVDFNALALKVTDAMYDEETDTRAIIAASEDRIVIAFKGTSSTQNLFTDLKIVHRSLSQVISRKTETRGVAEENPFIASLKTSKGFKRARVHAGFVDAYNSVKEQLLTAASKLLQEKDRPIYFTGHSLGGALATLCSLDIALSLKVPSEKLVVTTFGSPRVGNRCFQETYEQVVRVHWRIVAGGDIISRLPKIGYQHVGKKVILTSGGDLFIDPNALDMLFWDSQPASVVHHRKSCYLLALKSWCETREGDFVPNFWPFPISVNDSRKFETTFRKPDSMGSPRKSRHGGKTARARKYRLWAEAINELDTPIQDAHAVELWARLAKPLVEKDRESEGQLEQRIA